MRRAIITVNGKVQRVGYHDFVSKIVEWVSRTSIPNEDEISEIRMKIGRSH